jgi:site-specific DNA-methyltransferase (adenine-specific)
MPEQLLGRIIRTCSNPGEVVLDPFSGSATTLAVAKKLGRQFIGYDLSPDYVNYGMSRLDAIREGDPLDGSPEPTKSAPKTSAGKKPRNGKKADSTQTLLWSDEAEKEERHSPDPMEPGILAAFERTHGGFSADRVVADPELNQRFTDECERLGLAGDARTWNSSLFLQRMKGRLTHFPTRFRTTCSWKDCDEYLFASEIAWSRLLTDGSAKSLNEILCDPAIATRFDEIAAQFAPDHKPLEYRWAAIKLRQEAKIARSRASLLSPPSIVGNPSSIMDLEPQAIPETWGLYVLSETDGQVVYVGESLYLRQRLSLTQRHVNAWATDADRILVRVLPLDTADPGKLAWQCCLVKELRPRLNCRELGFADREDPVVAS